MFSKIGTVSIWVEDQDRAKDFYVNKLGMELQDDQPLMPGETRRWLSVRPQGAETELILYKPGDDWPDYKHMVGKPQPITLLVANIQKVYEDLTAKGVQITKPDVQPWGTFSTLTDSEGNSLLVTELPKQ